YLLVTAALLLLNLSALRADQAPIEPALRPDQAGALPQIAPVRLEVSNRDERSRLLIPRKFLADLQISSLEQSRAEFTLASPASSAMGLSLAAACLASFTILGKTRPAIGSGLALLAFFALVPGILSIAAAGPSACQATKEVTAALLPDFE